MYTYGSKKYREVTLFSRIWVGLEYVWMIYFFCLLLFFFWRIFCLFLKFLDVVFMLNYCLLIPSIPVFFPRLQAHFFFNSVF